MVEDDENWFDKMSVSSSWLDETISMLEAAKAAIAKVGEPDVSEHDGRQYGFKFRNLGNN